MRSATSRLGFVAGFEGAGVRASEDGEYAVDADAFAQFSQRASQRTDVRVIAEHSLAEQVEAHAVTWLDRQAFGERPDARTADNPTVQEAVQQRQEWLVQNGYARALGDENGTSTAARMRWSNLPPKSAPMWRNGWLPSTACR